MQKEDYFDVISLDEYIVIDNCYEIPDDLIVAQPLPKTKTFTFTVDVSGDYIFIWHLLSGDGVMSIKDQNGNLICSNISGSMEFKEFLSKGTYTVTVAYSDPQTNWKYDLDAIQPEEDTDVIDFKSLYHKLEISPGEMLGKVHMFPKFKENSYTLSQYFSVTIENGITVAIDNDLSAPTITLAGAVTLNVFNKISIAVNISACDIYLKQENTKYKYKGFDLDAKFSVTVDVKDSKYNFLGKLESISGTTKINTKENNVSLKGSVAIKNVGEFSAGFSLTAGKLSTLSLEGSGLKLKIGMVTLTSIKVGGGWSADKTLTVQGRLSFTIGASITLPAIEWLGFKGGEIKMVECSADGAWSHNFDNDKDTFNLSVDATVLNGLLKGSGKLNYEEGKDFSLTITVSASLFDAVKVQGELKISNSCFFLGIGGGIDTSNMWFVPKDVEIFKASLTINIMWGSDRTANDKSYIKVKVETLVANIEYTYVINTGNVSESKNSKELQEVEYPPTPVYGFNQNNALQKSTNALEKSYCITAEQSEKVIFAYGIENDSVDISKTDWELINTNGEVYKSSELTQYDNIQVKTADNFCQIIVNNAAEGYWKLRVNGENVNDKNIQIAASSVITVVEDFGFKFIETRVNEIEFALSVKSSVKDMVLELYYDDDNIGYDGFYGGEIKVDKNGNFIWSLPDGMLSNEYYFYVKASGDFVTEYSDYTDKISTIPLYSEIAASDIELLKNSYDNNKLALRWNFSNTGTGDSGEFYSKIIISDDQEFSSNDYVIAKVWHENISAGDTVSDNLLFILPEEYVIGDYYIAVVTDYVEESEEANETYDNISWITYNSENAINSSNYGQIYSAPTWNQGDPWNIYCPYPDENSTTRSLVGCGAIAVAQVVYALKAPKSLHFDSSDKYSYNGIDIDKDSNTLSFPSFAELNQALADIKYDGSQKEISTVAFAVAVKLQSEFGVDSTNTYMSSFRNFFLNDCNFDSVTQKNSSVCVNSDGTWKQEIIDIIADNVKNGSPVMLRLQNRQTNVGHFTFIEDYDAITNTFYVNLGWGGNSDGWYSLEGIATNYYTTDILYDIIPEYDGSVIVVNSTADYGVGTLRRAIELANSIKGENIIVIDSSLAGETITLNSNITISDSVKIVGLDDSNITISRSSNNNFFYINTSNIVVSISGLTFDGNNYSYEAISNYSKNLFLSDITMDNFYNKRVIYSASSAYTVKVDEKSEMNGYTGNYIVYIPNQVMIFEAEYINNDIYFTWDMVNDTEDGEITTYSLQYSLFEDFSEFVSLTVSGLTYLLEGVTSGINYFWRICGVDSNGNNGIMSEIKHVFTGSDTIAPEKITNAEVEVDNVRVNFSWEEAVDEGSGISHYILRYAYDEAFSNAEEIITEHNYYKLAGAMNNQNYYWQVAAVDLEGNVGEFSEIKHFYVNTDYLIIDNKVTESIKTEENVKILENGLIDICSPSTTRSVYGVWLRVHRQKIILLGDIKVNQEQEHYAYGIYGDIIESDTLGGSITITHNYYSYGIYAKNITIKDFVGKVEVFGSESAYSYGIRVSDAYLEIDNFSGLIRLYDAEIAMGLCGKGSISIGNFTQDGNIVVEAANAAYGIRNDLLISSDYNITGGITIDSFAGVLSVNSFVASAYAKTVNAFFKGDQR